MRRLTRCLHIAAFTFQEDTQSFKKEGDPFYGADDDLSQLDADGFAYAYVGVKEAFDALEWSTPHEVSKKFDDDMKDLCGKLPEGVIGLNKTACLSNAVNQYLANRTRWADAEGNGLIDKLVEIGGGDVAVLRKVIVDKMLSETGWKVRVEGSSYQVQGDEQRTSFVLVFPDYFLGQHSHVCLSTLVATELRLDTEALAKNNKIALRLVERTSPSPLLPPFMGPIEEEAVLARWDIVLRYGGQRSFPRQPHEAARGDEQQEERIQ